MRSTVHLNYDWKYIPSFKEEYTAAGFDDSGFQTVNLPHTNIETPYNNFDEQMYQFISCYRRKILIPEEYEGKVLMLRFEGVACYAQVYVNGKQVCFHKGGYTPFECNIASYVEYGAENTIAVMVDSTERDDIPPFGHALDYMTFGGIYREVSLEVLPKSYIENVFVRTRNVLEPEKLVDMDVLLSSAEGCDGIRVVVEDAEENTVMEWNHTGELGEKVNLKHACEYVKLWDIGSPNLYQMKVFLLSQNEVVDEYRTRFGFREVQFTPKGFFLNGRKVKIRGLNRHQSYPYVGYAMPKSAQREDADILKYELGVNLGRTSHYPQSRHFLDRCDEIGLLVFEETPGWQHIGEGSWKNVVCENIREMIRRDFNHPSIIIWGVRINESPDDDGLYTLTNKIAHELDDTRPTGGVRKFAGSHLLEDVYTYNDFIHRGENQPLDDPMEVAKADVPYLVTEHNGHMFPTKSFDHESKCTEHALRHLRVMNKMYATEQISGSIGWCMADYNTHKDFGSGDRVCYHGVLDMFRCPKQAASAYASQKDGEPVMAVSSEMNIGEYNACEIGTVYVYTNCDTVKLYKNDKYIGDYHADTKQFGSLPHPPVVIDDFIGNQLVDEEGFSEKDAAVVKKILVGITQLGFNAPSEFPEEMAYLKEIGIGYDECIDLYGKYVGNWGEKQVTYRFDGYNGDEKVCSVTKTPASKTMLEVKASNGTLIEDETYDVARISVKAVSEYGNLLPFSNDVVSVEVSGPVEVIGPKTFALIASQRAFWVKTVGCSGKASVKISSEQLGEKIITLDVKKVD
ncbi:glycoside hydrolase family 2 protein [Candidatus Soleaferrea massiliensis]|uniref:glycoside hydrolase family 2 protein n=1 Tax=Candidatus Soleaferrea massiliensis TaxID=1470354 RepID=UPI00058F8AF9|nr:glycoside hydrolase family 2 TIM barrel-domain containing protein [Candidatus Soleaferrea massiliensis]